MKADLIEAYRSRTYPALLATRALFFAVCIFNMSTIDMKWTDKFLFGIPSAVILVLLAVLRVRRSFRVAMGEKVRKRDIQWHMAFVTFAVGLPVTVLGFVRPPSFESTAVFSVVVYSLAAGLFLGVTLGERIFLAEMKAR